MVSSFCLERFFKLSVLSFSLVSSALAIAISISPGIASILSGNILHKAIRFYGWGLM